MVSVDKETGKILAEQCEQPEDIFKLSDANLLFGMLGTRSYRSFPVWGRMEKDGLVQVVIPYELSLYEKGSTLTVPDELKKIRYRFTRLTERLSRFSRTRTNPRA